MHNGDILTDSRGASWILDGSLGRGLWGRSFALKGEDGTLAVLKVPLAAADLQRADHPEALAEACGLIAAATRNTYEERPAPFLPKLLGTVALPDGRQALVMPRYDASLAARLAGGVSLSDVLDLAVRCLHLLTTAKTAGLVHGNLRPSNVFVDGSGNPVLSDPALPVLQSHRAALEAAAPDRASWLPPEAHGPVRAGWDTWALCLAVWRACSVPTAADDPQGRRDALPEDGVGRVALATLKDAAAARLKSEGANKRFAARAVAKLGAVLNRGLSPEHEPSPPYRFERAGELLERLVEVDELLHPRIESVTKALLGSSAKEGVFEGGERVSFTVHVGATNGVTAHDDLAVGLQLLDLDAKGEARVRIDGSRFTVNRFPAGKWRYQFELPDVPPGRYRIKVAFMVKDEVGEPEVAEGTFEVRPRPGWVPPPPAANAPSAAIPLPVTSRAAPVDDDDDDDDQDERPPQQLVPPKELRAVERVETPVVRFEPMPESVRSASRAMPIAPDPSFPGPATSPGRIAPRPPASVPMGEASPRFAPDYSNEPSTSPGLGAAQRSGAHAPPHPGVQAAPPSMPRPSAAPPPRPAPPVRPAMVTAVSLAPPPVAFEPATSPSLPSVGVDTEVAPESYVDSFLHDYPPPAASGGDDLPTYDLGAPPAPTSPFSKVSSAVLGWFGGDPWSAGMALIAGAVVAALLATTVLRSCGS